MEATLQHSWIEEIPSRNFFRSFSPLNLASWYAHSWCLRLRFSRKDWRIATPRGGTWRWEPRAWWSKQIIEWWWENGNYKKENWAESKESLEIEGKEKVAMVWFKDQFEYLHHGTPKRNHRGINGRIFRESRNNSNWTIEFETKNKDLSRFTGILQRGWTSLL